jgi:hypothetical protein
MLSASTAMLPLSECAISTNTMSLAKALHSGLAVRVLTKVLRDVGAMAEHLGKDVACDRLT